MGTFAGKTVLITGASEGIGRALALELAPREAESSCSARVTLRAWRRTARACRERGAEVPQPSPATWPAAEDCSACVAFAIKRFGSLDILVNNAGITMWARFDAVTDFSVYERLLAVNYLGAVHMTAAALPHLKRTRGLIVAIASIAGLTGVPERTGYAASKHAMVGFFESLRIELEDSGVDVTIVAPDFVVSEIHRRATGAHGQPLGQTPMQEGRIMTAARCAQLTAAAMRRRQRLLITRRAGRLGAAGRA